MKREIWTVWTGDKYSKRDFAMFCYSLEPYHVDINVLTDNISPPTKEFPRVSFYPTGPLLYHPCAIREARTPGKKKLEGWWNKLLFFSPYGKDLLPDDILFVDIDTLFINDPSPIFELIDIRRRPMIFLQASHSWGKNEKRIATGLFYINRRSEYAARIWSSFEICRRNPIHHGDQEFIEAVFSRHFEESERDRHIDYWPKSFHVIYKVIFEYSEMHKKKKLRLFGNDKIDPDSFVVYHFNGQPSATQVVELRLPGYERFAKFIKYVNRYH